MYPPVHPGVAYLLYALLLRAGGDRRPDDLAVLALVVGSVVPDLIDQPLYHAFALPSTRTLAHSLLVAVPVCLLVIWLVSRFSLPDSVGYGFAIGYLSHVAADAFWPLVLGKGDELGFLLWPVTHSPAYVGQKPLAEVGGATVTTLWVELPLLAIAIVVWWRDGAPGVAPVLDRLPTRR